MPQKYNEFLEEFPPSWFNYDNYANISEENLSKVGLSQLVNNLYPRLLALVKASWCSEILGNTQSLEGYRKDLENIDKNEKSFKRPDYSNEIIKFRNRGFIIFETNIIQIEKYSAEDGLAVNELVIGDICMALNFLEDEKRKSIEGSLLKKVPFELDENFFCPLDLITDSSANILLSVDLTKTDDILIKDYKNVLIKKRNEIKCFNKDNSEKKVLVILQRIAAAKIFQYLDLFIWMQDHNITMPHDHIVGEWLFPDSENINYKMNYLRKKLKGIISWHFLNYMTSHR